MAKQGIMKYQYCDRTKENRPYNKLTLEYFAARKLPYGHARRAVLLSLMQQGLEFYVNMRGCPNLRYDTDLLKMLKDGVIELVNEKVSRYFSFDIKHTFVRLSTTPVKKKVKRKSRK